MKRPQDIQRVFAIKVTDDEYEALFNADSERMEDYMMGIKGVDWASYDGEAIHFAVPTTIDQKAAADRVYEKLRELLACTLGEDLDSDDFDCLPEDVREAARENGWDAHDVAGHMLHFIHASGASVYRSSKPFNAEGKVLMGFLYGAFKQGADADANYGEELRRAIYSQGWSAQRTLQATVDFLDGDREPTVQSDWRETFIDFVRREMALEDARAAERRAGGYQPR